MFIFCLYVSQGSSRPPLLPPIPFRIYLPPRKNKVPGAALHSASCFVVFRRLFLCFFFLMLPDHQLSSSKRATRSPHDDKPNRAPPDPRTLPRYCPAAGTRLWLRQSVIFGTLAKNLTVTIIFSGIMQGSDLQRAARAHSPEHSSDGTTVKGPDVPARARRACVSEDRRTEKRKELVAPFRDR